MRSLLIMVVVVVSVVDAIAQQSMASLLSLARECLLTVYQRMTCSRKSNPSLGNLRSSDLRKNHRMLDRRDLGHSPLDDRVTTSKVAFTILPGKLTPETRR